MKQAGEDREQPFNQPKAVQKILAELVDVWLAVVLAVLLIRLNEVLRRALTSFGNGAQDGVTKPICRPEEAVTKYKKPDNYPAFYI